MNMHQKKKVRQEKNSKKELEENNSKMNINWFPGHMAKAIRLIKEELKNIDIVYEVIDARIPFSSKMKDMEKITKNKIRILIMTKKDLCDEIVTKKWCEYYNKMGYNALLVDLTNANDYKKIIDLTHRLTDEIQEKRLKKGLNKKEIRAIVLGVPNVGKSTLINKLTGKKSVNVENRPGVTKSLTYLKTSVGIVLLDTPGILEPRLDNHEIALNIASFGGIKKEILNEDEICVHILNMLVKYYPKKALELYGISKEDVLEMYNLIGKKIGAIKNGEVDFERVSMKVYNDLLKGVIRGVTFDVWK